MSKSADAFRTISEVADWLGVQAHVLRFWESKFTQVKPVKRAGGRRYYRPVDMLLLGGIKRLLHEEGLTIKGVQKILREKGIAHVSAMSPSLDDGDDATPQPKPAERNPVTPSQETPPFQDAETSQSFVQPTVQEDEIPEAPFSEDVPVEAETSASVVNMTPARSAVASERPSFTQDAVVMPEPVAEPAEPSLAAQPSAPRFEPVQAPSEVPQAPVEATEFEATDDLPPQIEETPQTGDAPETETIEAAPPLDVPPSVPEESPSEPQFMPHPLPQSSSATPSPDLDEDALEQEFAEPENLAEVETAIEAPVQAAPSKDATQELESAAPSTEEVTTPETPNAPQEPAPQPSAEEPEFEGTPDLFASCRVDPAPETEPFQADAPAPVEAEPIAAVDPVLDPPAPEMASETPPTEPQPEDHELEDDAQAAQTGVVEPQVEVQDTQAAETDDEKLVLPSFLHNRTPSFLDAPVSPVATDDAPQDLSEQAEEAPEPIEEPPVAPMESISEEVETSETQEQSSHDALFGLDFSKEPETTEEITASLPETQEPHDLEVTAGIEPPVEELTQEEANSEPVVDAPKKPRIVEVADPAPETEISVTPSVLSALAQDRILDTQQANAIEPLLAHLTQLRDRMSQARKE